MFLKWRRFFGRLLRDLLVAWMAIRDPGVPWTAKLTCLASVVYLVSPVDLIPDIIPVLGWLDDLAVFPVAAYVASRFIPFDVLTSLRGRADTMLLRYGPRAITVVAVVLALWLALAGLGGWLWWRSQTAAGPATVQEQPLPVIPPR